MKKVIAFDLDGTLAPSKSPLPDRIAELLNQLLDSFEVCVISGGKFEQFEKQLLGSLKTSPAKLEHLHIMPTCGTRYFTYNMSKSAWEKVYAEDFSPDQKAKIMKHLKEGVRVFGYDREKTWGEQIEDRGSQLTFSALGQEAPIEAKQKWDPTDVKKHKLRDYLVECLPDFEIRTGGTTSIDITKLGIDKAYGMKKLMEMLAIDKSEILFLGDALHEGGNDYPVKAMGVDSLQVSHWQDTALALTAILHVI